MPGVLVRVRPVAIMNLIDDGEGDDKIIAVPHDDPRWDNIKDLEDINKHTLKEIEHFFTTYKKLQHKEVSVTGLNNKQSAEEAFSEGLSLYKAKFSK